jgi:hypothetical protein
LPRDFARYATAGRFWWIFISPNPAVTSWYANSHPNIARITNTRQWIRGRVVTKSAGSGEPFLHRWMHYCMDGSFAMNNFKKRIHDH